jgi:hypothetical protein
MVIGGMMQFLAKAKGMPKNIETALTRIMRNFIWNNKKNLTHQPRATTKTKSGRRN